MLRHLAAFFIAGFAFLIFVIMLVITANSIMANIVTSRSVVIVPELFGAKIEEANVILDRIALKIDIIDGEYHEFPEGLIISQIPSSGRQIYKNRTIQVITSRGPKNIIMPELRGISFQSLNEILRSHELRLGSVVQHYSNDVPAGYVTGTVPAFGESIMAGVEVNIILSIGRDPLDPLPIIEEPPPLFFYDELFDDFIF